MMKMRDRCAGWNCRRPKLWYANSRSPPAYKNRKQSTLLEPLLDVGGTASFSGLEMNTFRRYTKLQVQAEPDYSFLPLKPALCCCSHEWLCLDSCNLVRSINTSAALCWSLLQLQWLQWCTSTGAQRFSDCAERDAATGWESERKTIPLLHLSNQRPLTSDVMSQLWVMASAELRWCLIMIQWCHGDVT